jgi:hypothetical protein
MLPAVAQPIVQAALTLVTEQLQMVTTLVSDLFSGLLGGTTPTPGTGTGTGGLGGLLGGGLPGLDMLQGILGGLFGGGGGGLLGAR